MSEQRVEAITTKELAEIVIAGQNYFHPHPISMTHKDHKIQHPDCLECKAEADYLDDIFRIP
jgi:hypothetical protein